ncbi:MAG: NAD(+) diphosphatase [Fibrobacter sp.]|nr:NAD(+) diphosphatase [Fibrobacter sp.]
MMYEIAPRVMHNEFRVQSPKSSDYVIYTENNYVLLKKDSESFALPKVSDAESVAPGISKDLHYLFSIDEEAFFSSDENFAKENSEFELVKDRFFRTMPDMPLAFGGAVAAHMSRWEQSNRFCGHCGTPMQRKADERAFICKECGNVVYGKICPVVIVSVTWGNKLLMAHNLNNPDRKPYLISGFVDMGESLEQAVVREVKEETGVSVKNIRYIGSEPWPFSNSLIAGFTAELDGSPEITVQEAELEYAKWVDREDIGDYTGRLSISGTMIMRFKAGNL